jgi:pimeloyl-ACP methyl ester carboxylesterase
MRPRHIAAAACTTLFVVACADQATTLTGPTLAASRSVASEASSGQWESIVTGETGPGSMYALYMPQQWNGTVVYYAHGIRDVLEPVSLRDQDNLAAIREQLGALHYAVAYSSFDENGYAVKDGAQRTHQLRGLFTSRFGQPQRSLVVGHSLGGLVALDLGERFTGQYDGAASFCGIVGGTQAEVDRMANARLLFDMFYPHVLEGTFDQIPSGYIIDPATQARIVAAIGANPMGLLIIASIKQAGIEFNPFAPPAEAQRQMVTSLITALSFHARGQDNLLSLTNGKFPFDNSATTYSAADIIVPPLTAQLLAGALQQINATAPRTSGDPSALNYTDKYFTPGGDLRIPTITVHNRFDPLVPYFHEPLLKARVEAAGRSDLLVQRTNLSYGHCNLTIQEQVQAITDLDQWVQTGTKPAN